MKKHYFLPLLQGACFMLVSVLLQNCGGATNFSIEGEEEVQQGRKKRVRIDIEQQQEQRLIEQGQEVSSLPHIMPELWQEIFSYLDCKGVLAVRAVSTEWNKLITGYREAGIVGVENNPHHIIDAQNWVKLEAVDFRNNKLKALTPATIPSFAFYHLMGHVRKLPQSFWPYLKRTNIHTLDLGENQIGAAGASELAKALLATRVHTLDLTYSEIGDAGAQELAKALPATQVHTLDLYGNQIGDAGAQELAKALPRAQVHTVDLRYNEIGDAGATELAKALPATQVHTLDLRDNRIGNATEQLLMKQYPHIEWTF
jgi:hypothetical protein